MADLFHLLDELNTQQDEVEQETTTNENEVDGNVLDEAQQDREILDPPEALVQAAKQRQQTVSPAKEEERLDLQDFSVRNGLDDQQGYSELHHWWVQELQAPELLPWNNDSMPAMIEAAFSEEDETSDGSNLEAILNDIRRVDKERVQFVVANLLQTRLQKIQIHPWFYQQNNECLSKTEILFLKDYLESLENHLKTTVTNHFPQEAWRRLDEPEMIEEPNIDQYVMVKVLEDSTLGKQVLNEGSTFIVCYREIRSLLASGAVKLIM